MIFYANHTIEKSAEGRVFSMVEEVPVADVALVLGTSKYSRSGNMNLYFKYRIEAAAKLYFSGKAKHFILSGDNNEKYYNEPRDMRKALISKGVPASAITLDYAGFRTLDSVVRAHKVFGVQKLVVISQLFHNQRAIYIGKAFGIDVYGFNAIDVHDQYSRYTHLREYLARVKAVLDVHIFNTEPKFLGPEIPVNIHR